MKLAFATIAANLVSLACIGVAGYLAVEGKEGWGWFLFVALIAAGSVTLGGKDKGETRS